MTYFRLELTFGGFMALQLVLGPSGAGKSEYIYDEIISGSQKDPKANYILLVPEQYSLAIQRRIAMKHERKGSFQIDVIGFNRLAYRVFDELHIKPAKVLEDFGKSMLIRQAAGEHREELRLYGNSLDKAGFIDEAKSLMSELYQYDVPRENLEKALSELTDAGEDLVLSKKLQDMLVIFEAFEHKKGDAFIVAEQMLELLTDAAERSELIANSEIVLDGFTGFTPIQLKLIETLLRRAKKVTVLLTIDYATFCKKHVPEHALFALTKQTMDGLFLAAERAGVCVLPHIFMGENGGVRWEEGHPLHHLERNLFRYPYAVWEDEQDDLPDDKKNAIQITVYDNPNCELTGVAQMIRALVMKGKMRYKDIAVVSGNLEQAGDLADRIFPLYEIPYFVDMTRPVKNHPCVDAILHCLRIVSENFTYDSVFAFLKSGVVQTMEQSEIEMLENYVLAKGRKGIRSWSQPFLNGEDDTMEELRVQVMEILQPFYKALSGGKKKVSVFVSEIYKWMEKLSYETLFEDTPRLYEKLCELLDKMLEIMPEDKVDVAEFEELFRVGMKDISLGLIPPTLDMVVVGDITRTRLSDIRALFIVGVNDGVIPKRARRGQIINDREKERLDTLGVHMAPTERVNSYTEQFYLYQNMTKPKEYLYLSYVNMSASNEPMRPSYILERIKRIFPSLREKQGQRIENMLVTKTTGFEALAEGLQELLAGNTAHQKETLLLYRLFMEKANPVRLLRMEQAMRYHNIPKQLEQSVAELISLQDMAMSVSKLEQYAKCAYAFFLRYVLRLEEREIHGIDNRNVGTILHGAMEQMFCHVRDNMANDWKSLDDEKRDALTERFVKESFQKEYENQNVEEGQFAILMKMLIRVGKRTVKKLQSLIEDSYEPRYFEQKFKKNIRVGDTGQTMTLVGVVDRGDVRIDPETHTIYLRVIDYKSGAHDFDLGKLYEGLELQLAIYTDVMTELVRESYNKNRTGELYTVIPDEMFYYHMQDPYVEADTEEEAEQVREKKLKYNGIEAKEHAIMDTVVGYAGYKAGELASQIKDGIIPKNPEKDGQRTACDFCEFKDVCRFDEKYGKNRYHYTKHNKNEQEKLLEVMSQAWHGQKNSKE